jgi:hypothetical protein
MKTFHLREKFTKHFQDSDLSELFITMCDLVEGTFDPWEKINDLKIRFYEFDEDEFDFDNWLINAGQFVLTVKAHVMLHKEASAVEVERLCKRLQDELDAIKDDFFVDEHQYYYSFSVLAEFLKLYVKEDITDMQASGIESFMEAKLHDLDAEDANTRCSAVSLVIPYVLDALKIHPDIGTTLLKILDRLIEALTIDQAHLDDALGLCVRTLAFTDYSTTSPDDQFDWALTQSTRIADQFIGLTSGINLAIGHSLRNEKERAEELLSELLAKGEPLPSPKKEIHLGFLMRGCIEARILSGSAFDAITKEFQDMTQQVIERIQVLNAELTELTEPSNQGEQEKEGQGIEEQKFQEMESVFIIFSGILDNLAMAGVHSRNAAFLDKVEKLMEQVQEINIVINFSSKLASYYREIGDTTGKARSLVSSIVDIIDKEVEHVFLEDLFDFFLEFSRNALDLAYHEGDAWYVDRLEAVFATIKTHKNLDEEDLEGLQYQVLSAMNTLLSAMWNDHFGKSLLQGFSSVID